VLHDEQERGAVTLARRRITVLRDVR
jgi:hypothetical protein